MNFKVLIVDDDATILFLHKHLIVKSGISQDPLTFVNGKEALDFLLADESEDAYFVFLDINMPVMNGWEFLEELKGKEISSRVYVAIVTSSIDKADREKANSYELVTTYLSKPFTNLHEVKEMMDQIPEKVHK